MRVPLWFTAGLMIGPCALLTVAAARGGQPVVRPRPKTRTLSPAASRDYTTAIQPLIHRYCLACHSTKVHKAGLDLQRFTAPSEIRGDLKSWQGVIDHLTVGDMPPAGMPQLAFAEKSRIVAWVQRFLKAEASTTVGDPGDVPLRRLSNTEYNCTIRDLCGVDLQPAREFPADGAAGEGFTNAAESLTDISPTLLSKYFSASKDIADHAVLLPDGFRFGAGKSRREWTDECTAELRKFYSNWTGPEGKLDFTPYLAATIRYRYELTSGKITIDKVAAHERLNAKYLGFLWKCLTDPAAGYPLAGIQTDWRAALDSQVSAVAVEISAWQNKLWQTARVGSYVRPVGNGFAESLSRQVPNNPPAVQTQTVRFSAKPEPGQSAITFRLSSTVLTGDRDCEMYLRNPRFEALGKPALMLKDYAQYGGAYEIDYRAAFANSTQYLAATIEAVNSQDRSMDEIAGKYKLNPELLQRWIEVLSLRPRATSLASEFPGRAVPAVALDVMSEPVRNSNNLPAINGWRGKGEDLPILVTNSSDKLELIPGNASPHSVMVHPNPSEFVGVVWNCPVTGTFRVDASIIHAHPACGNGIAWWLEHRRGERAAMWDEGRIELGGSASPPERNLTVQKGDQIMLAVDAKDGDHSCDLTKVALKITQAGRQTNTWDLAADVADSVLKGNPHADSHGNPAVWSFVKGPTRSVGKGTGDLIPAGCILDKWRTSAADSAPEVVTLAQQVQSLLSAPRPDPNSGPNGKLYDLLVTASSPLLTGVNRSKLPKLAAVNENFGIPNPAFFVDAAHTELQIPVGHFVTVRLPAALMAEREFVADGAAKPVLGDSATVIFEASTVDRGDLKDWDGTSGIITTRNSAAYHSLIAGFEQFRTCFPLFLCYPNVIPIDEVVNLKMFHREDEPLKRLFLSDDQTRLLDRLWEEHQFISRQPAAENRYLPLFIGFVTQDQPKEMVSFFEGQRPAFKKRSDAFVQMELAAIPEQLAAMSEFASRAFRRPLSAKEKDGQRNLYQSLRSKGASHDEAFRGVLSRILVSPEFLFRIEQPALAYKAGPVSDWELATRLSYFLWSSEPDQELRKFAAAGRLHNPDVLRLQTRRMLKDGKIRSLAIEFGEQWLHVRGFETVNDKNEKVFPTFDESLRTAMSEETILFFQDLFQENRSGINILNANYTYLNDQLAKHYAIPGVTGSQWRRVEMIQQYGRGGVLGLASVQASVSGASRTSPVLRGNWVVETLLGERMPRPPPNVPKLPEVEGGGSLTVRQEVEQHSKNPACAVCHRRMDPYGFALEHYDAIGRYRDRDMGGLAIDDKATLRDGTKFAGIDGLRHYLTTTRRDQVMRLFCRRLVGYSLGRSVINSDQPLIDKMAVQSMTNDGIGKVVEMVVESPQFRMIRGRTRQIQ